MARPGRTYAQIDSHYLEDDKILEAGDAWVLHFAAILACKRNLTDGTITRRQLARVAPESVPDVAPMIDTLIRVGLFNERDGVIEVNGWSKWNSSADEIETMSKGGLKGNHLRHHVNRGVWGPKCAICKEQKARGLSLPESPTDRPPSRREDVDEDFDLDPNRGGDGDPLAGVPGSAQPSPPAVVAPTDGPRPLAASLGGVVGHHGHLIEGQR